MRILALVTLFVCACGGGSTTAPTTPMSDDDGGDGGTPPMAYPLVVPPLRDPDLHAFEPFNYDDTVYPNGLSGLEGAFGFAHPWNDADGDVQDRVIGGSALPVASDLAPPSTGGRSIHFGTTGTSIFRDLSQTFGEDGTTVWVSYRWISTDTTPSEALQVVDFNDATGAFGCTIGQVRGLAGDTLTDGTYDLADNASGTHADIAPRDQSVHFVVLRFSFGPSDADRVDCWWDPTAATFDVGAPDASIPVTDASFSRVTVRSVAADSLDELYIGSTFASVTRPAQRMAVYRIGNSLTWDSQPEGIEALAGQAGFLHDEGFHINCANTLEDIFANPAQVCLPPVDEYGTWDAALAGAPWQAVTLQPFYGGTSTLGSDEDAILAMIAEARTNPQNADARFYIYAAWPRLSEFAATWTSAVDDEDDTPTVLAHAYFAHLVNRVRAATSARVYLIPVSEILHDLDQRLQAGDVPGLTGLAQLYRDDIHLSNDLGRFVAGLTTFATLYATDPAGLVKPERWYGTSATPFTPAFYDAVRAAIWTVIAGHPHTGVAAPL